MTWVVVVADKVDEGGLALLSEDPQLSVVKAIKNPAKLKESLPGPHAPRGRTQTT